MHVYVIPTDFTDATAISPAVRRALADARKRVFRAARRAAIARKAAYLNTAAR